MIGVIFLIFFTLSAIASDKPSQPALPPVLAKSNRGMEWEALRGIVRVLKNTISDDRVVCLVDGYKTAAGILLQVRVVEYIFSTPEASYSFNVSRATPSSLNSVFERIRCRPLMSDSPYLQYAIEEVDDMKVPALKLVSASNE